jgi:sulfite exporter TauE/SafE
MLSSITPLGERGRRSRWAVTVGVYVGASIIGGAIVGAAAGAVGLGLSHVWRPSFSSALFLIAIASIVAMLLDFGSPRVRIPGARRQVNENWLSRYRSWVYALGFGLQLGLGLVTIVASASVYLTIAIALVSASTSAGAVIGGIFGLSRAAPMLATRRLVSPIRLLRFHQRLNGLRRTARAATITVEVAATAAAMGLAVASIK